MSYFTQAYNWYFDVHPFRPTMKERRQKDLVIKQIKETKNFKFRKVKIEQPKIVSANSLLINSLLKNKNKIKLLNSN